MTYLILGNGQRLQNGSNIEIEVTNVHTVVSGRCYI
jgi:hypothetical protein